MWERLAQQLWSGGVIEYGIFQRERKPNSPMWRRHKGGSNFRFASLGNALFADKGARSSCVGVASYPKAQYSASSELLVPYVATWVAGQPHAYLVRASAGDPEITVVSAVQVAAPVASNEAELSAHLAAALTRRRTAAYLRRLAYCSRG